MRSASCRHRRNNRRRRRLPVSIPLAAIAISVANIARANRALERDLRSLRAGGGGGGSSDSAQSRPRRKLQMVRTADTLRGNGTTTATVVPSRLPNVLLIGAQKAGSTALAHWLYDRGVCKPQRFGNEPPFYRKEVHFFDDDGRYAMGEHFYAHRFRHCYGSSGGISNASWAMDATPATLRHAHRVRATYEAAGDGQADAVKILVILRDPVARDLSLYNHMTHKYRNRRDPGHEEPYFKDVTRADNGSVISYAEYVDRVTLRSINATDGSCRVDHVNSMSCLGLYAHYLRQWMDLFDRRRQILILSHDELRRDEEVLLGRVRTFLGLSSSVEDGTHHPGDGALRAANTKDGGEKVALAPCPVRDGLDQAFGTSNEALYRLLRERPGPPMEQVPFPKFALSNCTSLRQPS